MNKKMSEIYEEEFDFSEVEEYLEQKDYEAVFD